LVVFAQLLKALREPLLLQDRGDGRECGLGTLPHHPKLVAEGLDEVGNRALGQRQAEWHDRVVADAFARRLQTLDQ
jgi:hypothetical protein